MFRLTDSIRIHAPLERCFLLSTSVDVVRGTLGLRAVSGKTTGLVEAGDRLLWRGWKFGVPAMHETLITGYDRPCFFQDTMGRGRFQSFQHDHRFRECDGATELWDEVRFTLPLGPLGRMAGQLLVVPHVRRLLHERFQLLQRLAEGDGWRQYLSTAE